MANDVNLKARKEELPKSRHVLLSMALPALEEAARLVPEQGHRCR